MFKIILCPKKKFSTRGNHCLWCNVSLINLCVMYLNGSIASSFFLRAVFRGLSDINGMIWFLTICNGLLRKHDKSFGALCRIMAGSSGNGLSRTWRKPRMWPTRSSWTNLIRLGVSRTLLWPGVTLLSLGWIGHIWALYFDFHLGHAGLPGLAVFWVFFCNWFFQFVPRKRRNVQNWHHVIHGHDSLHPRLALDINKCLTNIYMNAW